MPSIKISLAYCLRAVSALLAILLGTEGLRREINRVSLQLEDQPQIPASNIWSEVDISHDAICIAAIACGVLVLVFRWNLLVPLWLYLFGMFLFDISAPRELLEIAFGGEPIILLVVLIGLVLGLLPPSVAYAMDQHPPSSVPRALVLTAALLSLYPLSSLCFGKRHFCSDTCKRKPPTFCFL